MPTRKCKKTNNNSQDNMSPLESMNPTTTSIEYLTTEEQESDLKINFVIMMIEVLMEEETRPLKEIKEWTIKNEGNQ